MDISSKKQVVEKLCGIQKYHIAFMGGRNSQNYYQIWWIGISVKESTSRLQMMLECKRNMRCRDKQISDILLVDLHEAEILRSLLFLPEDPIRWMAVGSDLLVDS